MPGKPVVLHTAIDARDCRGLAEFYRELLGLHYRPGDEPAADEPAANEPHDPDWLVLLDDVGDRVLAIQRKPHLKASTWPSEEVPMQMHLDLAVASRDDLEHHRRRAEALGATLLHDRTGGDDADEPLYVLADPAGHPFCLLVR